MYKSNIKTFRVLHVLVLMLFITTTITFGVLWYKEYTARLTLQENEVAATNAAREAEEASVKLLKEASARTREEFKK